MIIGIFILMFLFKLIFIWSFQRVEEEGIICFWGFLLWTKLLYTTIHFETKLYFTFYYFHDISIYLITSLKKEIYLCDRIIELWECKKHWNLVMDFVEKKINILSFSKNDSQKQWLQSLQKSRRPAFDLILHKWKIQILLIFFGENYSKKIFQPIIWHDIFSNPLDFKLRWL